MSTARNNRTLFGLLAIIPAILLLCSGYVVPTAQTLYASLTDASLVRGSADFVGLRNYAPAVRSLGAGFASVSGFVIGVLVIALVLGGGLGLLAHRGGRWGRRLVYLAFALPLAAVFAPAVLAVSWFREPLRDLRFSPAEQMLAAGFGALVALGAVTALLAARGGLRSVVVAGATLAAGLIAAALQAFTFPVLGVNRVFPAMAVYTQAFQTARFGLASATSVLLLIPLMVLGIGVTVLLILTRTRIEPAPRTEGSPGWLAGSGAVVVVLGLVSLAGLALWLPRLVEFADPGRLGAHLAYTWLPPILTTVAGVGVAALAGYGIGALRPFGDRSELLLLPFAPWLFTGLVPLMVAYFDHSPLREAPAFLRLLTPGSLVVPVVVGSALLFRGLAGLPAARIAAIAGPVLGAAAYAVWLLRAQQPLWALLAVTDPGEQTMPVTVFMGFMAYGATRSFTGWVYPLPIFLLTAAVIAVVLIVVVDRLTVRTGRAAAQPVDSAGDQV